MSCTIIINFSSFGFNIMNMCITTIEIQQTIFVGVYDHRRFYSCKQNNNYSLTYMNNCIAINMIQSYSCSTQTPNNIYLGSTLIPKVEGVCDGGIINLGITSNTHRHLASTSVCLFCNSSFEFLILATELVSNTHGLL